jgi:alkylresorcinol/alkylpyrone synthase
VEWKETASLTNPEARESLRFESRAGMLRNVLTREVPALAAEHAEIVFDNAVNRAGLTRNEVTGWIFHAGGRDVLLALAQRFNLMPEALTYSREALRKYGNLSSAFVYFVLDAALTNAAPGGWWWMSSFGAGFTCHGALLAVE